MRAPLFILLTVALAASAASELRIGVLLPSNPTEAQSMSNGITTVAKRARTKGTNVEIFFSVAHGQWGTEGDEAARLVLDERVAALIAPRDGAATHLALQVAGRTATPVITLCPDASAIGAGVPWAARVVPSTLDEARPLFEWGQTNFRAPLRWIALVPEGRAGREISRDLRETAEQTGAILSRCLPVPRANSVGDGAMRDAIGDKPGGVLLWLERAAAERVAVEMRAAGFDGVLAGPQLGAESNVTVAVSYGTAARASFQRDYVTECGAVPDAIALASADAVALLIALGPSPRTAFPLAREYAGVTGALKFDARGNRVVTMRLRHPLAMNLPLEVPRLRGSDPEGFRGTPSGVVLPRRARKDVELTMKPSP